MLFLFLLAALTAGTVQLDWTASSEPQVISGVLGERIVMEGAVPFGSPGDPAVPVIPVTAAIPAGAVVDGVEIISSSWERLDMSFRPMAVQNAAPVSRPEEFTITVPNPDAFSRNIKTEVLFSGQGTLMGYPVADFLIRPFAWDPVTENLTFSRSVSFEISYHLEDRAEQIPSRGIAGSQVISQIMNTAVLNSGDLPVVSAATDLPYGEYLIIADDNLAAAFEPLAQMKTWKGVQTQIVTMSSVLSGASGVDNAQKLRNFLFDIYQNNPPTYILLAGDTPGVPHRNCYATAEGYTGDPSSDLYYQDMNDTAPGVDAWNLDGDNLWGELNGQDNMDYHPDYVLGRASVETAAEAETFVNKVLVWEDAPDTDDWYTSMGFTTGVLWSSPYCPGSAGKEKVDTLYTPSTWTITKLYDSAGTQSYTATMAMLNQGRQLVNHAGHGSEDGVSIGTGYLDTDDFMGLTNISVNGRPTIWNTIACLSGSFDTGTCFAEAWIRSPGGGGFCIMNTRYGWGEPAEPGDQWSELVDQEFFAKFFNEDMYNLGTAFMMAKDEFIPLIPSDTHYDWIAKSNTLFGDPELPMYTQVPAELQLTGVDVVQGIQELTVTVTSEGSPVEGARVCLLQGQWDQPVTYAVALTDPSGAATLTWTDPLPASPDQVRVTAWARDHITSTDLYDIGSNGVEEEQGSQVPAFTVNASNPVTGTASISWELPSVQIASIDIVDLSGRTVHSYRLHGTSGSFSWNTSADPAGVYFIRMITDTGSITRH
ncbi:hypothetical protein CSA37_01300, partial [Candidatus Fermentibacteria bacterium]